MGPARWGSRFRPGDPLGGTGGLRAVRPWRRRRSAGLRQGVPVFLFEASRAPPLRTWPTVPAVPHPGLKRSPVGQRARSRPAPVPRALRARDARMCRAGAQSRQACQWPGRSHGERADFTGQSDSGSDGSWVAPRPRRPARRPASPPPARLPSPGIARPPARRAGATAQDALGTLAAATATLVLTGAGAPALAAGGAWWVLTAALRRGTGPPEVPTPWWPWSTGEPTYTWDWGRRTFCGCRTRRGSPLNWAGGRRAVPPGPGGPSPARQAEKAWTGGTWPCWNGSTGRTLGGPSRHAAKDRLDRLGAATRAAEADLAAGGLTAPPALQLVRRFPLSERQLRGLEQRG